MVRNLRPLFTRMSKDLAIHAAENLSVQDQNQYRPKLEDIIFNGMSDTAKVFTRNIRDDLNEGSSLWDASVSENVTADSDTLQDMADEIAAQASLFIADQTIAQATLILDTNYRQMRESLEEAVAELTQTKTRRFRIEKKAPIDAGLDFISYADVAKKAAKIFKTKSRSRPDLIASQIVGMTESFSKQTEAEVLNENDVAIDGKPIQGKLQKSWNAILDSRTREAHAEADAEYMANPIDIDENFIVDGEELEYPRDPNGSPGNVINCRCAVMYVTD